MFKIFRHLRQDAKQGTWFSFLSSQKYSRLQTSEYFSLKIFTASPQMLQHVMSPLRLLRGSGRFVVVVAWGYEEAAAHTSYKVVNT